MGDVTISVLGGFQLSAEGKMVTIPSKGVELLSFLAIHSHTPTGRDRVSGVLWPEFPQERALANLSTTLWRIRTAVGACGSRLILKSRGGVILNKAEVDVDLWHFEESTAKLADDGVDRALAARAVSLYTGDLLEGQCDAAWLVGERERIRQTYVQALQHFGDREATAGNISEAIRAYELALKTDPLNEGLCRMVMKLNAFLGKRTEALRVFHAFRRNLHEELTLDPEGETVRLSEMIKEAHFTEKLASEADDRFFEAAVHAQMVGRQAELQELASSLSGVATENSQWIGLEGEIGIGKTRLVLEFCRLSKVGGYEVVYSRCPEFPQPAPYSILKETLSGFPGLWGEIEAVVDEQSAATSTLLHPEVMSSGFAIEGRVRARCSEIIAARLREEADQVPLVLALEDIQYSDRASLELILNLQPLTRTHRLFTVLTWRSGDCPEAVSTLIKSQYGIQKVIRLSRLDKTAVHMMCQNYLGISPLAKDIGDLVYEQSEGNPLFAIECLKTLRIKNRPRLLLDAHHEQSAGPENGLSAAPAGIHAYVEKRMQMLSKDAAHLLRVAAACGREIEAQFLVKMMDLPLSRILHLLSSLVSAGFVVQSEDRFEFTHDKIRQLCYERIPVRKWVRLHGRIYRVLEAHFPGRLEALAFHSGRAGLSRKSTAHWERIGDRALTMWAHADACSAYSAALEQLERGGNGNVGQEHRFQLLRKRALAFEHGGELERGSADVTKMQEVAQDLADERKSCEALCLESGFLLRQGVFGRALAKAQIAGMIARNLEMRALEIQAGEISALAMYRLGDYPRAEEKLLKLGEMLETSSDVEGLERIWNNLGRVQVVQGRHLQALDSLERAERYGTGDLHHRAMRSLFRGIARGCMARGDEAILEMNLAARDFARMGNWSGYALVNAYLSHFYVSKGDLVSGILSGRKGLPFKAGKIDARWAWNSASTLSFGLWFILGNYRRAEKEIARFLETDSVKGNPGVFLDTAAAIALEEGKADHAFIHAKEAVQRLSAEGGPVLADALLTLGRCYLAIGQPKEAVNVLERAVDISEESSERLNFPRMWSFLAIAETDLGLTKAALVHSRRAVELLTESGEFAHIPQDVYWNHFLVLQNAGDPRAMSTLYKGYRLVSKQAAQLGRAGRKRFLAISVNRQILDTWAKVLGDGKPMEQPRFDLKPRDSDNPHQITAFIPSTGAPWGRPLRPSEYVEVIWTVDAGKRDQALKELKGDLGVRRARILRLCAEANVQGGDPREEDLARVLGVTTRTIRSDIAYLRAQGCHVQTRGTNLH